MTDRSVNEGGKMPFAVTSAGRVFYEERGSGLPVVLLHATLHDHRDFDLVAGPLAERYRTIAVDWPGHGQSDQGGQAVDAFLLAKVLAELVESLDLPPAVLIGTRSAGSLPPGSPWISRAGWLAWSW
jgi:pimeloyl-ACP methyl ester carboxylesterase